MSELVQSEAGEWVERRAVLPKVDGAPRGRVGYAESRALGRLSPMDDSGKGLAEQLLKCREQFALKVDTKRLACFDAAIGTPFR